MKKTLLFFAFLLLFFVNNIAQMTLVFDTRLSEGTTVTLPLNGTVNVKVDWGDGSSENYTTKGHKDHTYASEGEYTVNISGSLTGFGAFRSYKNVEKLIKVTSFGDLYLSSLASAFSNAINLVEAPKELPSTVSDLSNMFWGAERFNQNIGKWDVSNVTKMGDMFSFAKAFNQDIGNWDVSNVTKMGGMFSFAKAFNQDIGNWDVSNVKQMEGMFSFAEAFNQDIGKWDVSNVTNMSVMFSNALAFNQDIGKWDVGKVIHMNQMFANASSFNQDIGGWDVSNVRTLSGMFEWAFSFNQDIGNWNLNKEVNIDKIFSSVNLSTPNYNSFLIGWSQQIVPKNAMALKYHWI